jgi:hypothetical protein
LSTSDRKRLAAELHRDRLVRGLEKMRPHVRPAVARSYVEIGWIDQNDIPSSNTEDRNDAAAVFRMEDSADDIMSEDAEAEECL